MFRIIIFSLLLISASLCSCTVIEKDDFEYEVDPNIGAGSTYGNSIDEDTDTATDTVTDADTATDTVADTDTATDSETATDSDTAADSDSDSNI